MSLNAAKALRICFLLTVTMLGACSGEQGSVSELPINPVSDGARVAELMPTWTGQATSFDQRGDEQYSVGYFVSDGSVVGQYSLFAEEDAELASIELDTIAQGLGFSAVIAHGADTDLRLSGTITAGDDGDGSTASDFSGLGAMVVASRGATVTLDSMDIRTEGFLRSAAISDDRSNVIVRNSNVVTMGANPLADAYDGYVNGANMMVMISPPWVLGIQGGVRAFNMLGEQSTLSLIESNVASGGWALLSVDAGTQAQMNIVDSSLRMLPEAEGGMTSGDFSFSENYGSGYGTYAIGGATQNFYGASISGTTFAGIFTGGEATYASSQGEIALRDGSGDVFQTLQGAGRPTIIDSVFGFMSHGDATLNVVDGTQVNSQGATFLYKSGAVTINFDSAELNPASGIILQMMDNDDRIVGGSMEAFNTEFNEDPGWPSENGNVSPPGGSPEMAMGPGGPPPGGPDGPPGMGGPGAMGPRAPNGVEISFANGEYRGNLLNGSGYYGLPAVPLTVSIGSGADLAGAIALTENRHIDESGAQNTHFTINEYYYLGHVENRNYRNGNSTITVNIDDGGIWTVTGESLLNVLTVGDGQIRGLDDQPVRMTVDGEPTDIQPGRYEGEIVVTL